MGRLSPLYSSDQRDAVVAAVLEEGLTAREAAEAAAAGRLGDRFEPSVSTVQGWVAAHTRREGVREPGRDETHRVLAVARKTISRVEAMDAPTAKDLHAMERAQDMVNRATRASRPLPRTNGRTRPQTDDDRDLIARMQAELDADVQAAFEHGPCQHSRGANPPRRCWFCRGRPADPTQTENRQAQAQ